MALANWNPHTDCARSNIYVWLLCSNYANILFNKP